MLIHIIVPFRVNISSFECILFFLTKVNKKCIVKSGWRKSFNSYKIIIYVGLENNFGVINTTQFLIFYFNFRLPMIRLVSYAISQV